MNAYLRASSRYVRSLPRSHVRDDGGELTNLLPSMSQVAYCVQADRYVSLNRLIVMEAHLRLGACENHTNRGESLTVFTLYPRAELPLVAGRARHDRTGQRVLLFAMQESRKVRAYLFWYRAAVLIVPALASFARSR